MRTEAFFVCGSLITMALGCTTQTPDSASSSTLPSKLAVSNTSTTGSLTNQAEARSSPFLFSEADLPQGYPAPGPVGVVLLKNYPAARIAINRGQDQDSMFMPLFNHIQKHNIAMSSPVEITWSDPQTQASSTQPAQVQPEAMAFVYRQPDLGTPGIDGQVEVMDVPTQTFLSIGIRGEYNRQHLVEGVKTLKAWLADNANAYSQSGQPRYLGYNSPFVPAFLRFGEVQIPVTRKEP